MGCTGLLDHYTNHESGYEQFNASGITKGSPNFGAPDGWGVFQIDHRETCATDRVSSHIIWNWQANVAEGIAVAKLKRDEALKRQLRLEEYNMDLYLAKGGYVDRPNLIEIPGTTSQVDPVVACAIQDYNGAAGPRIPAIGGEILHCLEFIAPSYYDSGPNVGEVKADGYWQFRANQNSYVAKVLNKGE